MKSSILSKNIKIGMYFFMSLKYMQLKTTGQIKQIVNNIQNVVMNNDITLLSKQSYDFLYLCGGFIAHYNHFGFMDHYSIVGDLVEDIIRFKNMNQWENFTLNDSDYQYYMQKRDIYNQIVDVVENVRIPYRSVSMI